MKEPDKYYYFPTMTKNIMFVRDEKYICMSNLVNKLMIKGNTYIVHDFINGNILEYILFRDELGSIYRVSAFDVGNFISVKKYRRNKLERLNEKAKSN